MARRPSSVRPQRAEGPSLYLHPHPQSPSGAITSLRASLLREGDDLCVRYVMTGDIGTLAIPAAAADPQRADGLWKHTCFEAFIGAASGYFEFNFSPSTQWAAYRFDGYRSGMREAGIATPRIETSSSPSRFELRAELTLPEGADGRLGLSAVIEEKDGTKSWWALAHPPGTPDFHDPACFALELPAAV